MISLNYRDSKPIYQQIKDNFKKLIISGAMPAGDKLQSVRSLAVELSINPNTIQRAYNELEAEGYIYSVAAKGSFVAELNPREVDPAVQAKTEEILSQVKVHAQELKFLGISKEKMLELITEVWNMEETK